MLYQANPDALYWFQRATRAERLLGQMLQDAGRHFGQLDMPEPAESKGQDEPATIPRPNPPNSPLIELFEPDEQPAMPEPGQVSPATVELAEDDHPEPAPLEIEGELPASTSYAYRYWRLCYRLIDERVEGMLILETGKRASDSKSTTYRVTQTSAAFFVLTKADDHATYYVSGGGCSCPAGSYQRPCKHVAACKAILTHLANPYGDIPF